MAAVGPNLNLSQNLQLKSTKFGSDGNLVNAVNSWRRLHKRRLAAPTLEPLLAALSAANRVDANLDSA
jgi:hypothetical protein